MKFVLQPWQLYLVILAGWINRQQQIVIEYLCTENQVLKQKLGKKRILLNDGQRRLLAVKGKALGRKALSELTTIVTPDTILRWHRQLITLQQAAEGETRKASSLRRGQTTRGTIRERESGLGIRQNPRCASQSRSRDF